MNLYVWGAIGLIILSVGGYVTYQGHRIEQLKVENFSLERDKVKLETEKEQDKILDEARALRQEAATNLMVDNALAAEKEKQDITAEQLQRTSERKNKLVEKAAHKAIKNNVNVLSCLSDLRSIYDEAACPGSVR
jgi:hypothetical protein